jgi:hypothetical protein
MYETNGATLLGEQAGNRPMEVVSGDRPLWLAVQPDIGGLQTGDYTVAFSVPY